MALREILTWPHPVLKKAAKPVDRVDDSMKKLVEDMLETMYAAPGVGLAAPQVGESIQLCVIDVGVQDNKPGEDVLVLFKNRGRGVGAGAAGAVAEQQETQRELGAQR